MALWWCPKCSGIVPGQHPGICLTCGSQTEMVLKIKIGVEEAVKPFDKEQWFGQKGKNGEPLV